MIRNIKILFSPSHYTHDGESRGSELSWSFNIINGLASKFKGSVAITGFVENKHKFPYKVIELSPYENEIKLDVISALIFNIKYSFFALFYSFKKGFDIHHHVLPFSVGRTFDLTKVVGFKNAKKFIIGPIQSPIMAYKDNIADFSRNPDGFTLSFVSSFLDKIFGRLLFFLSKATLIRADAIVAIDLATKDLLTDVGVKSNNIHIIKPGINFDSFFAKKKVVNKKIRLITVSYLISRKRIDQLIRMAHILKTNGVDFNLTVIGDGPQKEELANLTEKLFLDQEIKFKGHIEHSKINKYYSEADIFVTMSESESWGQMYLEAMSAGLPVITYKNNGASNIISNKFGYFVSNVSEMSDIIIKLSKNKKRVVNLGKAAQQEVLSKYDWNGVILPQYERLYERILR